MRELVSEVDAEIRDIRGVRESHSELCNPEATRLPSLLGRRCGEPGRVGEGVSRSQAYSATAVSPAAICETDSVGHVEWSAPPSAGGCPWPGPHQCSSCGRSVESCWKKSPGVRDAPVKTRGLWPIGRSLPHRPGSVLETPGAYARHGSACAECPQQGSGRSRPAAHPPTWR